jgi:hypothetical protein
MLKLNFSHWHELLNFEVALSASVNTRIVSKIKNNSLLPGK